MKTLPLDRLFGFLTTYEMVLGEESSKKKKGILFNAIVRSEEELDMKKCYTCKKIQMILQQNTKTRRVEGSQKASWHL